MEFAIHRCFFFVGFVLVLLNWFCSGWSRGLGFAIPRLLFWSGFGVCELALQLLELRSGVCDPSTFFLSVFGVCGLALQWFELRVGACDPSTFFVEWFWCLWVGLAVVGVEEWGVRSIEVCFAVVLVFVSLPCSGWS